MAPVAGLVSQSVDEQCVHTNIQSTAGYSSVEWHTTNNAEDIF